LVAAVVVVVFLVGALINSATSPRRPSDAAETAAAPPATTALAPGTPKSASEPPGFGDGTYLVGTDIQPGLYRTDGTTRCYWERLSGVSGDFDAILANESVDGQAYVEVFPTDVAFSTRRCGRWEPATDDRPDVSGGFGDGTYRVGIDIQPGTYRSTGGSSCYWVRLGNLDGDFDAINANDNADGQAYVEILPTDVAFSTDDCGTWSRVG
jgi:hypothetical protein